MLKVFTGYDHNIPNTINQYCDYCRLPDAGVFRRELQIHIPYEHHFAGNVLEFCNVPLRSVLTNLIKYVVH